MKSKRRIHRASLVLLALLTACAGKQEEPAPRADALTAGAILLHVHLLEAPSPLQAALREWAEARGFELDLDLGPHPEAHADPPYTLVELDAASYSEWVTRGDLRALPPSPRFHLSDAGRQAGENRGVAWRGELHALVVRAQADAREISAAWPDLARWGAERGGLSVPAEAGGALAALYFEALASRADLPGADASGRDALEGESRNEAMGYLSRLARAPLRADAAARLRRVLDGEVGVASFDGEMLRAARASSGREAGALAAFPPAEPGGRPAVWIEPRFLVLPRNGAHRDVGEELIAWLAREETGAMLLADSTATTLPLHRELAADGADPWVRDALALRAKAVTPPVAWWNPRLRELVADAVDASLERRRSPVDALVEARARWEQEQRDGS